MPQNDGGLNSADPAELAEETPRLPHRNPAAKGILRMVFLAGVFALVLCVSRPYPLLDGGATTIWLLALCLCAGIILFGTPRDAAIISRDVALAMLPWLLAAALLANGAFDSSQEVLHPTSVVRTVYGRHGSRLMAPRQTDRVSVSRQILSLRPPWILFSRSAGYSKHPVRGARNAVGEQDIAITTDHCVVRTKRGALSNR
jgi:hypothetical protein